MRGMQAGTGKRLEGLDHLRQSIADILSTPIGSRVMRPEYGSQVFDLVDQPFNGATRMRLFGAVALALGRWEPRLRLLSLSLTAGDQAGAFNLHLTGLRTDVPARAAPTAFDLTLTRGGLAGLSIA